MTDRRAPAGVLCALVTPFTPAGGFAWDALESLVEFHIERGTHGLFVLGTTGEGPLLPAEDRKRVAAFVAERAAGRIPVVVHCGAPDTATVIDLARHAQGLGADGVAAVAPYYFRYQEEAIHGHFAAVARAAPDIAHYVYENPEVVGYSVGVGLVLRLAREIENIRGVKDTGDSIGRITRYLAADQGLDVYVGNNVTIFPAVVVGARGTVSAVANAAPELLRALYEASAAGRLEEARALQFELTRLHDALAGMPFVGGIKHLLERRGLSAGRTRAPQPDVTPGQAAEIDRRLAALPELERWLEPVTASGAARPPSLASGAPTDR